MVEATAFTRTRAEGRAAARALARRWRLRVGIPLLAVYSVILGLIAFWPVPVDRGAEGLLEKITRAVPWLTYDVVEFTANIALFVPLGVLLALALPRARAWVLPIALVVTLAIEGAQGLFLDERTASFRDVLANTIGAAIGLAAVLLVRRWWYRR